MKKVIKHGIVLIYSTMAHVLIKFKEREEHRSHGKV